MVSLHNGNLSLILSYNNTRIHTISTVFLNDSFMGPPKPPVLFNK